MSDDDLSIPDFLRRDPNSPRPKVEAEPPRSQFFDAVSMVTEPPAVRRERREDRRLSHMLSDLEGRLDDATYGGGDVFSTYQLMQQSELPVNAARAVAEHFRPRLEELRAVKPGCDRQLWEGYSRWKREDLNRHADLVGSIVDDAERYVVNNGVARRVGPRKHKSRSALRQVRDLKYLRGHGDLKLTSLDPIRLIGAATLWTYDVKRRILSMYVTNSRTGLEIKGTTIQRFDREASVCKVLRKPAETLDEVLNAAKTLAPKIILELKTKSTVPTGRVNENTILVRVT